MLRRIGNKSDLAIEIIQYFPKDITVFIDLFFGSGAMTWEMIKRFPNLYYTANDIDNDVYNLWNICLNEEKFNQFYELIEITPYHKTTYESFVKDFIPKNEIEKALQFVFLSNYSMYGFKSVLDLSAYKQSKELLLNNAKSILKYIKFVRLDNKDFRKFNLPLSFPETRPLQKYGQFVYADPPYIGTADNYSNSFTEQDTKELIEKLINSELRFCISEFLTDTTEKLAKEYNLNLTIIKERRNHKKRATEIIMTNYKPDFQKSYSLSLFSDCN
jgi:DNA adenine methylase